MENIKLIIEMILAKLALDPSDLEYARNLLAGIEDNAPEKSAPVFVEAAKVVSETEVVEPQVIGLTQ